MCAELTSYVDEDDANAEADCAGEDPEVLPVDVRFFFGLAA